MEKGREKDRDAKTEYLIGMRATNKVFLYYSVYRESQEKNNCLKAITGLQGQMKRRQWMEKTNVGHSFAKQGLDGIFFHLVETC